MTTISVPRAQVAELVGVAPDASDETLQAAIAQTLHQHAVQAAINDGRITAADRRFWLNAMGETPTAAAPVLASMPAAPRVTSAAMATQASSSRDSGRSGAQIDADPAYRDAMWRMGPRFRQGLKPPEPRVSAPVEYDDPYAVELIDNGDGTGYWKPGVVRAS